MSKELTPLEALKQMSAYHLEMGVTVRDLPNYEIIEKALYDLIRLQELFNQYAKDNKRMREYIDMVDKTFVDVETTKKKLKVLEIVRDYDVDIWLLKNSDYDNYVRIRKLCQIDTKIYCDDGEVIDNVIPKDKFDLLKEVMASDEKN